jgi:hypothetical protein
VWQKAAHAPHPSGSSADAKWKTKRPRKHRYLELSTGLHYQSRPGGDWLESNDQIELLPDGRAAGLRAPHKAWFPVDIYQAPIEVVTRTGEQLKSRPWGLCFSDGSNSVLIAELTNSVGQLLPSGTQVVYTNCFTEIAADLVVSYRKSGLESDLVFRQQLPPPEQFGFNQKSPDCSS